jgi:hypothetical protein
MPVTAKQWLRPLRGGSQTHLVGASDGHHYVVKLTNNPQGVRTLVNEWVSRRILEYLRIPCPATEVVELTADFIGENARLGIQRGEKIVPPPPGWHFGSRYPGDPQTLAVYDILPDIQLATCRNLYHFAGVLAFDKWTANADSRQCVFYRGALNEVLPEDGEAAGERIGRGFVATMIDHGYCFNGIYWDYPDAAGYGLYYRAEVYRKVRGWADFEPWLERIREFPAEVLDRAMREVPREWLEAAGGEEELERLLEQLMRRRARVPGLIEATRERFPQQFLNWR